MTEPELFAQLKCSEAENLNSEAEDKQAAGIFSAGIGKQYKESIVCALGVQNSREDGKAGRLFQ